MCYYNFGKKIMDICDRIIQFVNEESFDSKSISSLMSELGISRSKLIKESFNALNKLTAKLYCEFKIDDSVSVGKVIDFLDYLCGKYIFYDDEIEINRERIKNAREKMLLVANKDNNELLFLFANKLDDIVITKYIADHDLNLLIKELINRHENIDVIKKYVNANKKVLDYDNQSLFRYVFDLALQNIKDNTDYIYYYLTLLKIFYTTKVNSIEYLLKLKGFKRTYDVVEIENLLKGNKRSIKQAGIMKKYNIISDLPTPTILLPPNNNLDEEVITIDSVGTKVRDDAFSIKRDGNKYILSIHITDLGKYVTPGSLYDMNAMNNFHQTSSTRIWSKSFAKEMSLNKNSSKDVITVSVVLNDSGDILDYSIKQGTVFITSNFWTDEADLILSGKKKSSTEYLLKELSYFASIFRTKNQIRQSYYKKKNKGEDSSINPGSVAGQIVSEGNVLFNTLSSRFAYDNGIPFVYSYQDNEYITELLDKLNIVINDDIEAIVKATYLSTKFSTNPRYHSGNGENVYGKTSSPLRRYPDFNNELLLHAYYFKDIDFEMTPEMLAERVEYFNRRKEQIDLFSSEYGRALKLTKN